MQPTLDWRGRIPTACGAEDVCSGFMAMPVLDARHRVIAVVEVGSCATSASYSLDDEDIFSTFCAELSSILKRKALEEAYAKLFSAPSLASQSSSYNLLPPSPAAVPALFATEGPEGGAASTGTKPPRAHALAVSGRQLEDLGIANPLRDNTSVGEEELIVNAVCIFRALGLLGYLSISAADATKFVTAVRDSHRLNPFHNFRAAVEGLLLAFHMLVATGSIWDLPAVDVLSAMLATLCANVDHP